MEDLNLAIQSLVSTGDKVKVKYDDMEAEGAVMDVTMHEHGHVISIKTGNKGFEVYWINGRYFLSPHQSMPAKIHVLAD